MTHEADVAAPEYLTVATYNVHRGIGTDGVHDPGRTAAVMRETGADLLVLQEVEDHGSDPGALARALGMTAVPGHTIRGPDSNYGNLLLTRLVVEESTCLDLSWGRREPRGLIDARLRTPCGLALRCLATHLGLSRRERLYQHGLLRALLAGDLDVPTLLMGDFNDWHPFARTTRVLNRLLGRSHALRSFPSRLPLLPLDRVWMHPAHSLERVGTWRSPLARRASDHLPVVARIRLSDLRGKAGCPPGLSP